MPRNLQAQWKIGVIQAKEALSMSPDKRIENFGFIYDADGPHLNPFIAEKLKEDPSSEMCQETESRLSQDAPSVPVSSPQLLHLNKSLSIQATIFKAKKTNL